jgi:predicted transcriptional regulator
LRGEIYERPGSVSLPGFLCLLHLTGAKRRLISVLQKEVKTMADRELSDPITMRLPVDVLSEIEEIAGICSRSRSWVFVRALKSYLAAEGREIIELDRARKDVDAGLGSDFDDVIDEVDAIAKGAVA